MRTLNMILFFLLTSLSYGYEWHQFSGYNGNVNNYCEYPPDKKLLLIDSGLVDVNNNFTFQTLPVKDAIPFNSSILAVLGDGSYSDGIYEINADGIPTLKQYTFKPHFITEVPTCSKYYCGSDEGLYESFNGLTWQKIPFFNSRKCLKLAYYGDHIVVATGGRNCISYNEGQSWQEAQSITPLTDLCVTDNGIFFGSFGPYSNSDGIYKSIDFGNIWTLVTWEDVATSLQIIGNSIFVGHAETYQHRGVTRLDLTTLSITSYNTGLPNLNINKIKKYSGLPYPAIICCTEGGAYYLDDPTAISPDQSDKSTVLLSAYPNPFNGTTKISYSVAQAGDYTMQIFNSQGHIVNNINLGHLKPGKFSTNFQPFALSSGVYTCRLLQNNQKINQSKLIYLK